MSVYMGHGPKYWYELNQSTKLDADLSDGHNASYWHDKYLAEVKRTQASLAQSKTVYERRILELEKLAATEKGKADFYNRSSQKLSYQCYQQSQQIRQYQIAIGLILVSAVFLMALLAVLMGRSAPPVQALKTKAVSSVSSSYSAPKPAPATTPKPAQTQRPSQTVPPKTVHAQEEVWIVSTGKCYHRYSSCSNMASPYKVTLDEARDMGYTSCSKCY